MSTGEVIALTMLPLLRDSIELLPSPIFSLDDDSQYRPVGWLCGPVVRRGIESRPLPSGYAQTRRSMGSAEQTLATLDAGLEPIERES